MSAIVIRPMFEQATRTLMIPTGTLNHLVEAEVWDCFNFYQQFFNVYSYMKLSKSLKHQINHLEALPFVWQPLKSCTIDPLGNIRNVANEIDPCKATAISQFCYDELIGSCYEWFLQFTDGAPVTLDENGDRMINELVNKIIDSMLAGARMTLTAGQLYDPATVTVKDNQPKNLQELFTKTIGTCKGWIQLVKEKASQSGLTHLNIPSLISATDFDGKKYTGNVESVFETVLDNAPDDLTTFYDEGGIVDRSNNAHVPMWLVSPNMFKAVAAAYRAQCNQVATTMPCWERDMMEWRGQQKQVYKYNGVVVIPVHDLNLVDRYLNGCTSMVYLTVSGNINMGTSFNSLPVIGDHDVAVRIRASEENENLGQFSVRSDSLFSTAISNTDLMAGGQVFIEPAA